MYLASYALPTVASVSIASCGFYIQQSSMPARVSLGIVAMLIVLTNYLTLTRTLPPGGGSLTTDLPWLVRLCLGSFYWTLVALVLLVLSSFGLQMRLWLEEKKRELQLADWQQVLLREREAFMQLVEEWDTDRSGSVTKLEFRKGIAALGVHAPRDEVNALFEQLDLDKDGRIDFDELDNLFPGRDTGHAATLARGMCPEAAAAPSAAAAAAATTASASAQEDDSLRNIVVEEAAGAQELGESSDADAPAAPAARATSRAVRLSFSPGSAQSVKDGVRNSLAQGACKVARSLEVENRATVRVGSLTRQTSRMRLTMRHEMRKDLGKSWWWSFKTFKLFPCLALLEYIDIPTRLLFPICYTFFLVPLLLEVQAAVTDMRRLGGAEWGQ